MTSLRYLRVTNLESYCLVPTPTVPEGGLDLATGVLTPWLTGSGQDLVPIGSTAGGDPLVISLGHRAVKIWLVTAPNQSASVYSGPGRSSSSALSWNGFNAVIADSGVTWLGTNQGLFELTAKSEMVKVANVTASPAGRCTASPG